MYIVYSFWRDGAVRYTNIKGIFQNLELARKCMHKLEKEYPDNSYYIDKVYDDTTINGEDNNNE